MSTQVIPKTCTHTTSGLCFEMKYSTKRTPVFAAYFSLITDSWSYSPDCSPARVCRYMDMWHCRAKRQGKWQTVYRTFMYSTPFSVFDMTRGFRFRILFVQDPSSLLPLFIALSWRSVALPWRRFVDMTFFICTAMGQAQFIIYPLGQVVT